MTLAIDKINKENMIKDRVAPSVGDTVDVHIKIYEGDKERVQVFKGTVIARDGRDATQTFTVRRISHGVGVEKVFPLHSPHIAKIQIESSAYVRRAKLYFLRDRVGKKTKLREKKNV